MTIKQLPYGRMQGYVIVEEYNPMKRATLLFSQRI